jgi:hypothetical protein
MQGKCTCAIFGNVGKWRDSNFYGISILNQGGVQSVANPYKSSQKIALNYWKKLGEMPQKSKHDCRFL